MKIIIISFVFASFIGSAFANDWMPATRTGESLTGMVGHREIWKCTYLLDNSGQYFSFNMTQNIGPSPCPMYVSYNISSQQWRSR